VLKKRILLGLILIALFGFAKAPLLKAKDNPVLLEDNFSSLATSKILWKGTSALPGSHLFLKDGVLRMNVIGTGVSLSAGDDTWGDYEFNVRIKFIQRGKGDNHSGFFIRDTKKFGKVTIIGRKNRISYAISGVITETIKGLSQEKRKVPLDDGKWHYFRFICKGSTINIWADGEDIGTIKNAPLHGGIGLYGYNDIVEFDDVRVMKIAE